LSTACQLRALSAHVPPVSLRQVDAHAAARPAWELLSAEWAYYHALKRDGGLPHEGATLNAMLAAVKSDGQPAENQWPYIKAPITDVSTWKPPASPAQTLLS